MCETLSNFISHMCGVMKLSVQFEFVRWISKICHIFCTPYSWDYLYYTWDAPTDEKLYACTGSVCNIQLTHVEPQFDLIFLCVMKMLFHSSNDIWDINTYKLWLLIYISSGSNRKHQMAIQTAYHSKCQL